jgi:DHA1 family tetracycline resistance protein-like MFS transporter
MNTKTSSYIAYLVVFIDAIGIGLVYPIFPALLFNTELSLLSTHTSPEMRGVWLGVLISLMPLAQFLSAPLWGTLSDNVGRKKPLEISLFCIFLSYILSCVAILMNSLSLLLISRLTLGIAAGNLSIIQATIADISTHETRSKYFSLYSTAMGAGFTLGPCLGGLLAGKHYVIPFFFSALLTLTNLLFALFYFKETNKSPGKHPLSWNLAFHNLKKAFHLQGLRIILLCSFLHVFGWSFFFEFIPIYLMSSLAFSTMTLGIFYGLAGAFYAISTGIFIRPLLRKFKPITLFFWGNLSTALCLLGMPFIPSAMWLWPFLLLLSYCIACVSPSSNTLISNSVSASVQGESLGILSGVNALAFAISPLCSGSFIGSRPKLSMYLSGSILLITALIILITFRHRFFSKAKL